MYCRECYYDLRGQTEWRCPECAARFDPTDAATYLSARPTRLQTFVRNEGVRTLVKLVVFAVLPCLVLLHVTGFFDSRCGPMPGRDWSRIGLRSIVGAYYHTAASNRDAETLTLDAIRGNLPTSWWSRSIQPDYRRANQWNRHAGDILPWCVLAIGLSLAVIVITRRWIRRLAVVSAAIGSLLLLALLVGCYVVGKVYRTSSYAYVNDYVVLRSVDWRHWEELPLDSIVAFEKQLWPGNWRVVAKGPGPFNATIIQESEFQELLSQQPAPREAWDACVASGECSTVAR